MGDAPPARRAPHQGPIEMPPGDDLDHPAERAGQPHGGRVENSPQAR
jgi:hypothetical protein